MPKRGGATRGGDTGSGGERKKTRVEKVEGVEALRAIIAEKDAVIKQMAAALAQQAAALAPQASTLAQHVTTLAQQAATLAQQAAALDELMMLIPHPPSGVWAESYFAEHATLRWTPCATGVVASELVIGAIDDATRERLDDIGRATSDAIGACVVDPRLVAGRGLRFFVTAVVAGADASRFRTSELSRPIRIGEKDFGRVVLNQAAVLLEDATALGGLRATPRGATHGKWSSKHHVGAMRVHHVRGLGLLRVPRLAKAAAARSRSLHAARSEVINTRNAMACIMRFATPYCTPTRAERDAVCNACHRSDDVAALEASLRAGIDPNTVDTNGVSHAGNATAPLLFIAAGQNHEGTVAALLAAGADVDKARTHNGCTPLYIAAEQGHLLVVERLIAAGADVDKATTTVVSELQKR